MVSGKMPPGKKPPKNCPPVIYPQGKNLIVVMPSYFYKDNKYKTWKSFVKKAILVIS